MGWDRNQVLYEMELKQLEEEGFDTKEAAHYAPEALDDPAAYAAALAALKKLPRRPDYPYEEPDTLEEILAASEAAERNADGAAEGDRNALLSDRESYFKKLHAAWTGRAAGCALGKPVECHPYMAGTKEKTGFEYVREWFEGADAYPIDYYTPAHSRAEESGLHLVCPKSQRENIHFMESDDDVRYTVLGLKLMEEKGFAFSTWDVGELWHKCLPYRMCCTAETQAYLNFAAVTNHLHPQEPADAEKRIRFVNTYQNPYREWIGAQIRVDAYGYAAAGDPLLAAKLAYRDAHLSHVKNGVYGAMFVSAMIAAAFTAETPRAIVEAGLRVIPKKSRLYEAITDTLSWACPEIAPEEISRILWEKWRSYDCVHTINNAACVAACVLSSGGDYERAVTNAVLTGWDTDCNGATVGSIMGAFLGSVPEKWAAPLHDTMYSEVSGFDPITFTDAAKRTLDVALKERTK